MADGRVELTTGTLRSWTHDEAAAVHLQDCALRMRSGSQPFGTRQMEAALGIMRRPTKCQIPSLARVTR